MGRWTVAEWLAQAQELSPLPSGEDDLWHEVGTYPYRIDTLVEEEDEEEVDGHGNHILPSPLFPVFARTRPPTPPPKTHLAVPTPALPVVPCPPAEGRVHKLLNVMRKNNRTRGKRGKAGTSLPCESEKPARITDGAGNFSYLRNDVLMASPTRSHPRSPNARRPREFLAGSNKRTNPNTKSKPASPRRTDGYTWNGHALEILISTQVTATRSPYDGGRPRVFHPRSSSLPSARNNLPPLPPAPPAKSPTRVQAQSHAQSSRALPALPSAGVTNTSMNNNTHRRLSSKGSTLNGALHFRPLPVPVQSSASPP